MDNPNVQPTVRRRHRSLAEELVTELSRRICSGELPRATKLPTESEVMAEHGVSRTVVRARPFRACRPRAWWKPDTASAPL